MTRRILVAVAWPYASGPRHLGHLAGAYLPADIFARYHRTAGHDVLMVSGSDVHGTPITVRADEEGVDPQIIVDRYHREFLEAWERLSITWDLYTSTGTENHASVTQDVFLRLLENGFLEKQTSTQYYDEEAARFLPDRYVEGTCPHCGYGEARGDQCDNCGRTLDVTDLIDPRSKLSGTRPVQRETEHFFLMLSKLEPRIKDWLTSREGWRKHVKNWALGMVDEGLPDRAITRDINWGVEVPVDDLGPGKRIYVWFDAVIGYLSASIEWAQNSGGDPEAWKDWWTDPDAESYYIVGKDNIPFHAVIWPAMLMGYGDLNLPTDVPANQYVTFGSEKASASRGIGRSMGWYLDRLEPDALRYAVASVLPEQNDTDLSDEEIIRRVNEELVATWGNLVNRVLSMSSQSFGETPKKGDLKPEDADLLALVDESLNKAGQEIERVELRAALRTAMHAATEVNAYLNDQEPWKVAKSDKQRAGTILWTALQSISGIRIALSPYLPFTTATLGKTLGLPDKPKTWERPEVASGLTLETVEPLFAKLDSDVLDV